MKLQWWHFVAGGGGLAMAKHIGFALGWLGQVVWEGFCDGVAARKASNGDKSSVPGVEK